MRKRTRWQAFCVMAAVLAASCAPRTPAPADGTSSAVPARRELAFSVQAVSASIPPWENSTWLLTDWTQMEEYEQALFGEDPNTWPAELRTKTMQYDHTFFKAHDLLVIQLTEPSGSITHKLTGLVREGERLKAAITRLQPYIQTSDLGSTHLLVTLDKGAARDAEVELAFSERYGLLDRHQLVRTDGGSLSDAPQAFLLSDRAALAAYRQENAGMFAFDDGRGGPSFDEAAAAYTDGLFEEYDLLLVRFGVPSGSITHEVEGIYEQEGDGQVRIRRIFPDGKRTADAACWHLLARVDKGALAPDSITVELFGEDPALTAK